MTSSEVEAKPAQYRDHVQHDTAPQAWGHLDRWRNWQTRTTQNRLLCGFKSHPIHGYAALYAAMHDKTIESDGPERRELLTHNGSVVGNGQA